MEKCFIWLVSLTVTSLLNSCVTIDSCKEKECLVEGISQIKDGKDGSAFFRKGCLTLGAKRCLAFVQSDLYPNLKDFALFLPQLDHIVKGIVSAACTLDANSCRKEIPISLVGNPLTLGNSNQIDIEREIVKFFGPRYQYMSDGSNCDEKNLPRCMVFYANPETVSYFERQLGGSVSSPEQYIRDISILDMVTSAINKNCANRLEFGGFDACDLKKEYSSDFDKVSEDLKKLLPMAIAERERKHREEQERKEKELEVARAGPALYVLSYILYSDGKHLDHGHRVDDCALTYKLVEMAIEGGARSDHNLEERQIGPGTVILLDKNENNYRARVTLWQEKKVGKCSSGSCDDWFRVYSQTQEDCEQLAREVLASCPMKTVGVFKKCVVDVVRKAIPPSNIAH